MNSIWKNNLVKSICNGVFKIAYCIWFFKMFYVISPIFTIITYFACAHFTISPQTLHNETTIFVIKLHKKRTQTRSFTVVAREGFEPTTPWLKVKCSADWAIPSCCAFIIAQSLWVVKYFFYFFLWSYSNQNSSASLR